MGPWEALLSLVRGTLFLLTHVWGGNLGWGIVTLSALVRLALLPWTLKAARRSLAMKDRIAKLAPRLDRLKVRYANDPVGLQSAIAREYQQAGIRPFRDSGLGFLFAQLPIGLALYTVIRNGIGAGAPFLWIANLSRPDFILALITSVLTAVLTITAPGATNSTAAVPMSLLFATLTMFFVMNVASGVALYWASSSGIGLLQNALVRRRVTAGR